MALVISRTNGQSVMVDGCATITVYCNHNVKLKIDAAEDVHILRGELNKETDDGSGLAEASAGVSPQSRPTAFVG